MHHVMDVNRDFVSLVAGSVTLRKADSERSVGGSEGEREMGGSRLCRLYREGANFGEGWYNQDGVL